MSVYVDEPIYPFQGKNGRKMMMCHMVADTLAELHAMAEQLGVRRHFQAHTRYPHYDICKSKRAQALALGALPCPDRKTLICKAKVLLAEFTLAGGQTTTPAQVTCHRVGQVASSAAEPLTTASPNPQPGLAQIELPYTQD